MPYRAALEPHKLTLSDPFFLNSHLHAFLPADPEVSPGEEAGHRVPRCVMDPPLLPQLSHDGIYPGKACLPLCPLRQCLWVSVPGDLDTHRVSIHLVKAGVVGGSRIKELPPQQLAIQRKQWGVFHLVEHTNVTGFT